MLIQAAVAAGLAATPVTVLAGTNTGGSTEVYSLIGSVITPALVVMLMLWGKLRTEAELKRLETDNQHLAEQLALERAALTSLQAGLVERAIPALTRSTLVLESLAPILRTQTVVVPGQP